MGAAGDRRSELHRLIIAECAAELAQTHDGTVDQVGLIVEERPGRAAVRSPMPRAHIGCGTRDQVVGSLLELDRAGARGVAELYEGWSEDCAGTCTGVGWRVVRGTPHQSYVPMQTFGIPREEAAMPATSPTQRSPTRDARPSRN